MASAQQQINLTAGPAPSTLPGWLRGADVGLQLRRGRDRLNCNLRQAESGGGRLVARRDHRSDDSGRPADQPHQQSVVYGWNGHQCVPTSLVIVGQVGGGLGTPGEVRRRAPTTRVPKVPLPGPLLERRRHARRRPRDRACSRSRPKWQQEQRRRCRPGAALRPGTYLIESGTHPSIQGPMGLYGILVVTTAPPQALPVWRTGQPDTAYPA